MSKLNLPEPKERTLYLSKQVDQSSINDLTRSIVEINESDEQLKQIAAIMGFAYTPRPIKIYIDSYGGLVYQCLGLLGVMEKSETPVHTIVTGCAMSCGFLIAIAGHQRFGYSGSTFLYHSVSSWSAGQIKQMEEDLMETKRLQKIIEAHTLRFTAIKKDRLKEVYERKIDWFIDSREALKLKIIDELI